MFHKVHETMKKTDKNSSLETRIKSRAISISEEQI